MEDSSGSSDVVIDVSVCDSNPLLWRVEDLRAVRQQGVVGALLGSLARTPRQNVKLGRPLLLLPEEERLIRGQCLAAAAPPVQGVAELSQQVALYEEQQELSHREQQVLALQDKKSNLIRAMKAGSDPEDDGITNEDLQGRLNALDKNFVFPRSAVAVQLSTARARLSNCPGSRALLRTRCPTTMESDPRFQVFKDLRGRGFFLTSAGKFGGDFLVYPGDPLRFHAHFIAVCQPLDQSVCLLDILAVARLGSNVKKTVLLCSPGPDGMVVYTSLQWSGMV